MPTIINRINTKLEVVKKARELREEYQDLFNEPDTSTNQALKQLVAELDGKITVADNWTGENKIEVDGDGYFVIQVTQESSLARDNFTIAHELGHLLNHIDREAEKGQCVSRNRSGSTRQEWEANWFAAELLMPEQLFKKKAEEYNNNIFKLAEYFGVSPSAAEVRLNVVEN